jgi:VIT1/CCC1 family predicted Fe2+/Mn2+ transporter
MPESNFVVSKTPGSPGPRRGNPLAMLLRLFGLSMLALRLEQRSGSSRVVDEDASRSFVLRIVQPGLAGLMDGSVSTLAPIFATAFATHRPFTAFLVGMASATGAGISMAFAEALSDNGEITGRGNPWLRGGVTGVMTFLGGAFHTLPFLLPSVHTALYAAYVVVAVELTIIAAIRHRFFGTNWGLSFLQVVGGGALVFVAAIIFGNA